MDTEASDAELERVLLLVLGCAVQSDEREQFIENIRRLDVDIQRSIVDAIQQVSLVQCTLWHIDPLLFEKLNLMPHLDMIDAFVKAVKIVAQSIVSLLIQKLKRKFKFNCCNEL